MKNKNLKIAVHDGAFHADDVFAIAILKLIYPKSKIIRTRDEKKLEKADLRVDVGRKYNPEKGDFDHHQKEFTKTRKNNIPYASAGLIWKTFGNALVTSPEAFEYIDKELIQPIDARDNGLNFSIGEISPYTIQKVVETFYPDWKSKKPNYDRAFYNAISFAKDLLKKEIGIANGLKQEKEFIEKMIKDTSKNYLIFENEPPNWKDILLDYPKFKYVIYRSANGNWDSKACRIRKDSFEVRKLFPKEWADLTNEKLAEITQVKDAIFCHKMLFIAVTKSKEGAIKLTELALKN